jgi:hypothetical protein
MGRYGDAGDKRIDYINADEFARSDHGKLPCTDCHVNLDKIPHAAYQKVDCSISCHVTDPSTNKKFSHSEIEKKYDASVHGFAKKNADQIFPGDLPLCQDCHYNRPYTSDREVQRKRTQLEIVELCTRCHRHGLDPIDNFKDTFHWELAKYGVKNAPDCITCHAPLGYSSHDIRPGTDLLSPINAANRLKTCSNRQGTLECHPDASAKFASGRVHTYEVRPQFASGESVFDIEGRFKILMEERTKANITEKEIFHYKVLYLFKLFYKVLIAVTISFMSLHQVFDYIRARKKQRTSP